MLLVRNGQLLATLGATSCQYATTVGGGHSLTETVLVVTATVVGLECSFHFYFAFLLLIHTNSGCKGMTIFCNVQTFCSFFVFCGHNHEGISCEICYL